MSNLYEWEYIYLTCINSFINIQWRIQEFSEGRQPQTGGTNLLFNKMFAESCMFVALTNAYSLSVCFLFLHLLVRVLISNLRFQDVYIQ